MSAEHTLNRKRRLQQSLLARTTLEAIVSRRGDSTATCLEQGLLGLLAGGGVHLVAVVVAHVACSTAPQVIRFRQRGRGIRPSMPAASLSKMPTYSFGGACAGNTLEP